jgi:acyl-coenzyme A thioesterase PaaI-like protein
MLDSLTKPNRLARSLAGVARLPAFAQGAARNFAIRRAVPFTGTAKLNFEVMTPNQVIVSVVNARRVQNHIGSVHAAAMALLAETASGMVVGMNVRDECIPLIKSFTLNFKRRAGGDMRAVASLSSEAQHALLTQDKGECVVPVTVTDASGASPIECEMLWAWVRNPKAKPA